MQSERLLGTRRNGVTEVEPALAHTHTQKTRHSWKKLHRQLSTLCHRIILTTKANDTPTVWAYLQLRRFRLLYGPVAAILAGRRITHNLRAHPTQTPCLLGKLVCCSEPGPACPNHHHLFPFVSSCRGTITAPFFYQSPLHRCSSASKAIPA